MERSSGGASTTVLEPLELHTISPKENTASRSSKRTLFTQGPSLRSTQEDVTADRNETLPSPTVAAAEQLQSWNSPRINLYRVSATFWAFTVMGMNDGSYGAIIPYLESYYGLEYLVVSLIFLSPFVGYNIAAVLNNTVHLRLGQRGVAIIGPVCHIIAYIVIANHPPYPVLVVVFILAGLGNGLEDSAWNAWIGAMNNANEVLGFLHGFYGLGATIAPLIATTMITKSGLPWYYWYYVMIGCSVVELGTSLHAFWSADGAAFREDNPRTSNAAGSRLKEATLRLPAARVTWLAALFLLGYVGAEVALGGWIVTFMLRVRQGGDFASGMTATGFWLGITLGRVVLGFVTDLSSVERGTSAPLLARTTILRLSSGRLLGRFLPWPNVSCGHGRLYEVAAQTSSCQWHWVRRRFRRQRRCHIPLCRRRNRAIQGRASLAAYHSGFAGCDLVLVDVLAQDGEEAGMIIIDSDTIA
nr:bypass of stop codon protein 6 [Quercus suber]